MGRSGAVRIHGALIAAFAKALDSSADEILGTKRARPNGATTDRRVVRLLQQIGGLSRRERDTLLKTISNYVRGASTSFRSVAIRFSCRRRRPSCRPGRRPP